MGVWQATTLMKAALQVGKSTLLLVKAFCWVCQSNPEKVFSFFRFLKRIPAPLCCLFSPGLLLLSYLSSALFSGWFSGGQIIARNSTLLPAFFTRITLFIFEEITTKSAVGYGGKKSLLWLLGFGYNRRLLLSCSYNQSGHQFVFNHQRMWMF